MRRCVSGGRFISLEMEAPYLDVPVVCMASAPFPSKEKYRFRIPFPFSSHASQTRYLRLASPELAPLAFAGPLIVLVAHSVQVCLR